MGRLALISFLDNDNSIDGGAAVFHHVLFSERERIIE